MEGKNLLIWDRETSLTFASMLVASYAWITTERLLVGIAVGIAVQSMLTVVYEALAARFNWQRLRYVEFLVPFVARFLRNFQRA